MPKLPIAELKRISLNAKTMQEQLSILPKEQPTIIIRSFNKAPTPPVLQKGIQVFAKFTQTPDQVQLAYGDHPTVAGNEVINAIVAYLGGGNWQFHVSDKNYTAYSSFELQQYITNFDSTDLLVWITETFDCDNFATVLNGSVQGFYKGIPFGILWYGPRNPPFTWGHAVNIFYDAYSKKVYLVEPQTDGFFSFDKVNCIPWMVLM